jgi:hypothetical protein
VSANLSNGLSTVGSTKNGRGKIPYVQRLRLVSAWIAAVVLLLGVGAGIFGGFPQKTETRIAFVKTMPMQIGDWVGEDVPLGENEVLKASVRLLNYDDYIFRRYHKGAEQVFVYAMYWRQGSISVREIAGHTPDGCWVANGAALRSPKQENRFVIGSQETASAEVRDFIFPHHQQVQVAWWHIWGENLVDRSFDHKTLMPTLRELWIWLGRRHGARHDQLLVRIHTTGDLAAAMKTAPVTEFLKQFPVVFSAKPL